MFVYSCVVILLIVANECSCRSFVVEDRPDTGVPCEWQNVTGTCLNYWTCLTNAIDAVNGVNPPVCSTNGNEVMTCCTSCSVVANISSLAIVTDYMTFEVPDTITRKKCIEYMRHYRYPCTEVSNITLFKMYVIDSACYHAYGWSSDRKEGVTEEQVERVRRAYYNLASLGYGEELESARWLCGGSIISERYILTAAHCGHDDTLGAVRYVAVGVSNRSEPLETWQVYDIDSFIPHPDYKSPLKYHDIALIKTATRFYNKFGIPGVLGVIDGTHVAVIAPVVHEERFVNRKGFHSLNVMIICDADLKILCVDASRSGNTHDATVWQTHQLSQHLIELQSLEQSFLLGDSGYALRETMVTPILNTIEGTPEHYFYQKHVTARNTVERCIGVLKARFRITYTRSILPACLSQGDDAWPDVGFPYLWRNGTLQQMEIIFQYDLQECINHYSQSEQLPRGFENTTQICFGSGKDNPVEFIKGDFGAPLQTGWCPTCVLGVTISDTRISGQNVTFRRSPPGLYTRVEYYLPWIESVVWP